VADALLLSLRKTRFDPPRQMRESPKRPDSGHGRSRARSAACPLERLPERVEGRTVELRQLVRYDFHRQSASSGDNHNAWCTG
jgi:hypothetical protein